MTEQVQESNNALDSRVESDRRQNDVSYKRRVFDRRLRAYLYERTIHLTDTNMFGSVYYARFFDLQGEAREEFLQFFLDADFPTFISQKFNLVTVEAHCRYAAPLFLYNQVVVKITVPRCTRTKLYLDFVIERTSDNETAAIAKQVIGFTTSEGVPTTVPDLVRKNLQRLMMV